MDDWPPFEYASDEHLDGLSRDALYSEIRFLVSLVKDRNDEISKLRRLAYIYYEYCDQDRCTGCVTRTACADHLVGECWMHADLEKMALELGIVDGRYATGMEDVPMWVYQDALDDMREVVSVNESLESENGKLRALLKELYEDAWWEHPYAFEFSYADRLAEFGINAFLDEEDE